MISLINAIYNFLWGDLVQIPLPGGSTLGISLLVMILVPAGIYFTIRTHFLPLRMFPEMIRITLENNKTKNSDGISGLQALIVSTACRVGMGNLVGVVAAISAGGAGAVFWMWLIALLGASTAFIEATLAQIYKEKDPLYGGTVVVRRIISTYCSHQGVRDKDIPSSHVCLPYPGFSAGVESVR